MNIGSKSFKVDEAAIMALTADDWGLFTVRDGENDDMPERSAAAAEMMNFELIAVWDLHSDVNDDNLMTIWNHMSTVMGSFSECGASDTEPRSFLKALLAQAFGETAVYDRVIG